MSHRCISVRTNFFVGCFLATSQLVASISVGVRTVRSPPVGGLLSRKSVRTRWNVNMANDSDAEDIEVDLRDKNMMLSPEMVVGMTTHLSEESTASTELALSYVIPHHEENKTAPDNVVPIAEAAEEELIEAPSVQKILRFAIPAIGVWLCSPLLSLIDTSAVGLLSGTSQQAALNPAVAVTEYAALLIVCTCV